MRIGTTGGPPGGNDPGNKGRGVRGKEGGTGDGNEDEGGQVGSGRRGNSSSTTSVGVPSALGRYSEYPKISTVLNSPTPPVPLLTSCPVRNYPTIVVPLVVLDLLTRHGDPFTKDIGSPLLRPLGFRVDFITPHLFRYKRKSFLFRRFKEQEVHQKG